MIYCHVTTQCNLSCPGCFSTPQGNEMTLDEWLAILDAAEPQDVDLDLTGGEPLTVWSTLTKPILDWQAAKYARNYHTAYLSTNATLMTQPMAEALAARGVVVSVSLHGGQQYVDALLGEGTYLSIIAGLDLLRAAGARMRLRLVATRTNMLEIPHFLTLCGEYATTYSTGYREKCVVQKRYGCSPVGLSAAEEDEVIALVGQHPELVELNSSFRDSFPCGAPSITIRPDGKLIPCAAQWETVLGDARTEDADVALARYDVAANLYACRR